MSFVYKKTRFQKNLDFQFILLETFLECIVERKFP